MRPRCGLMTGRFWTGRALGLVVMASACRTNHVPDLTVTEAAQIISGAPEFNRYARLLRVGRLNHPKDSMAFVTFGAFSFVYLNAPPDAVPIEARVEFYYHEARWYLSEFSYVGYEGPRDFHTVNVYDGPDKKH